MPADKGMQKGGCKCRLAKIYSFLLKVNLLRSFACYLIVFSAKPLTLFCPSIQPSIHPSNLHPSIPHPSPQSSIQYSIYSFISLLRQPYVCPPINHCQRVVAIIRRLFQNLIDAVLDSINERFSIADECDPLLIQNKNKRGY